jgi:glucose dehydrogenase
MHIVMMIAAGLVLLLSATLLRRGSRAALPLFLPLWALVSVANMVVGVLYAGYGWAEEALVLIPVFGVPALAAWALARFRG